MIANVFPCAAETARKSHSPASKLITFSRSVCVSILLLSTVNAAEDNCNLFSSSFRAFEVATNLCSGKKGPFVDPRIKDENETNAQCRVFCLKWENPNIVAVQRSAKCEFCTTNKADPYYTDPAEAIFAGYDKGDLCVPSSKCIEECGDPDPGCVYTGSCLTWTCSVNKEDPSIPALVTVEEKDDENSETGEGISVMVKVDNSVSNNNTATGGSSGGASIAVAGESSSGKEQSDEESKDKSSDDKVKIIAGAISAVLVVIAAVAVGLIVHKLELCARQKNHENDVHAASSPA